MNVLTDDEIWEVAKGELVDGIIDNLLGEDSPDMKKAVIALYRTIRQKELENGNKQEASQEVQTQRKIRSSIGPEHLKGFDGRRPVADLLAKNRTYCR